MVKKKCRRPAPLILHVGHFFSSSFDTFSLLCTFLAGAPAIGSFQYVKIQLDNEAKKTQTKLIE